MDDALRTIGSDVLSAVAEARQPTPSSVRSTQHGGGMAKADKAREELGWLKVVFAVSAAVDASLLAWLAQKYGTANADITLIILAVFAASVLTGYVVWMNAVAYRRIRELESL
ncbi:MAG TPA: hypothetical protein VLI89_15930 [Burkholderiales bacterium]|nr:hypothetical protein [Burkholderiales bacterium]